MGKPNKKKLHQILFSVGLIVVGLALGLFIGRATAPQPFPADSTSAVGTAQSGSDAQPFVPPGGVYQNYVRVELRRVNEDNAGWIVSIVDETGHGTTGPITCGMSGTEMPRMDGGTIPLSEIQCGDILMVYTKTNEICESFPGQFAGDYTFAYVRPGEPGYVSSLADDPFFAGYGT